MSSRAAIQARLAAGWRPTEKRKKVTDETLRAPVDQGLTLGEIAAQTGMSTSVVKMRLRGLRKRGVSVPPAQRPRPTPWRRASDEQLLACVKLGLKQRDIAAQVGLSIKSLESRLRSLRDGVSS